MNDLNYCSKINILIKQHVFNNADITESFDFAYNCNAAMAALAQIATNAYSVDMRYSYETQIWYVELFDRRTCKGASAKTLPLAICFAILSLLNVPYRDI